MVWLTLVIILSAPVHSAFATPAPLTITSGTLHVTPDIVPPTTLTGPGITIAVVPRDAQGGLGADSFLTADNPPCCHTSALVELFPASTLAVNGVTGPISFGALTFTGGLLSLDHQTAPFSMTGMVTDPAGTFQVEGSGSATVTAFQSTPSVPFTVTDLDFTFSPVTVPEPDTVLLLVTGALMLIGSRLLFKRA